MKRTTIKRFYKAYQRSLNSEGNLPPHEQARWYGKDAQFYHKVWKSLQGDTDGFLFDDYVDIGFDISQKNLDSLKNLNGDRLNKLHAFASKLLTFHALSVMKGKIFYALISLAIPLTKYLLVPLYEVLTWAWVVWVILVSSAYDLLKEFGRFLWQVIVLGEN